MPLQHCWGQGLLARSQQKSGLGPLSGFQRPSEFFGEVLKAAFLIWKRQKGAEKFSEHPPLSINP